MSETYECSFDSIVQKEENFIFIRIPFSPRALWGKKPRYSVVGTINSISVHGTLGALGEDYFLRLSAGWLQHSGIELGENVTVHLSFESPQEYKINSDIAKALSENKKAKLFFDELSAIKKKNFIRWIENAKREETRAKRINEMIKLLEEAEHEK